MSLAINPLGQVDAPVEERPKIYSDAYRHSIVDSAYQPEMSLLSMVDGTPRLTEIYRPFLGADEETFSFAPSNCPTYQSYTRISKALFKQEGDGAFDFDPEKGESSNTYQGWLSFDIAPTINTVMVFDIGDGNAGLARVTTQPEIRNITANKVYSVTVQMVCILTKDLWAELDARVVEELVYSKDSVLHGGVGLVTTKEFEVAGELFQWKGTIANAIMRNFYWDPERTIAWEYEGKKVYDQYLVNFINAVMEPDYRTTYPIINQFSTEYGAREYGKGGDLNIWEVLLRGDFNLLDQCTNEAKIIETTRLVQTRFYGNLRSSKFQYFVATDPERYLTHKEYYNMEGFPILRPSHEEKITYLFSEGFYQHKPSGEFEELVYDILKNRLVDKPRLLKYCKTYFQLTKTEQLYNGAILLLLIQLTRRLGGPL